MLAPGRFCYEESLLHRDMHLGNLGTAVAVWGLPELAVVSNCSQNLAGSAGARAPAKARGEGRMRHRKPLALLGLPSCMYITNISMLQ